MDFNNYGLFQRGIDLRNFQGSFDEWYSYHPRPALRNETFVRRSRDVYSQVLTWTYKY